MSGAKSASRSQRGRRLGPISLAMLDAAAEPGTVRQLAERSFVGYAAARCCASRLVQRGLLVPVEADQRPLVLVAPTLGPAESGDLADVLGSWGRP